VLPDAAPEDIRAAWQVRKAALQPGMLAGAPLGLHVAPIRLTPHPMPVDGLVVGQTPAAGERVRRDGTLTVQVWHPSEPGDQQPPAD
jgi:hypothetical protein